MPTVYNDARVRALVKKVKVEKHPQAEEFLTRKIKASRLPVFWETIVEITARGKKFAMEVNRPKGTPGNPLTETELVEKFKVNASYSMLPSSRVKEIIQTIGDLERLDDITSLTKLLVIS
jgi:2-methylcitrate dehydratase PrpD